MASSIAEAFQKLKIREVEEIINQKIDEEKILHLDKRMPGGDGKDRREV
jgi:hypothetical protein